MLVTGGAQGIGRATAARLAADGWRVAIADNDAEALAEARAAHGALLGLHCDVSDEDAVRRAVGDALAAYGRLDALVNNAGITGATGGPLDALSLAEWNRRIGTNLTGVFLMAKHCAPALRAAQGAIGQRRLDARTAVGGAHRGLYRRQGRRGGADPRPRHEPRAGGPRQLRQPRLDRRAPLAEGRPPRCEPLARRTTPSTRSAASASPRTSPPRSRCCSPPRPASSPGQLCDRRRHDAEDDLRRVANGDGRAASSAVDDRFWI